MTAIAMRLAHRAAGLLDRVLAAVPDSAGAPVFDGTPGNPTESATLQALAPHSG